MIEVRRMGHATFETPDIDRQIDYFTEISGLVLAERQNGRAYLATRLGNLAVQLVQGETSRCSQISFQAAPGTDINEIRRGIEAEGVRCEVRNDTSPGIPQAVAFKDPKGTTLEVYADQTPVTDKRASVSGIAPFKLGHLAFVVEDPKPYSEFYAKVLGFRVSDWIEDWFCFMRCGPDHHTINFVRGKTVKMHHVAFEVRDTSQLIAACDFLGTKKIPIIWGPGRHGPGHNVYIYHRNPDDQVIETFCELDKMLDEKLGCFDPRPWHGDHPQKPKTWSMPTDVWGPPPTREYLRQRE